MAACVLALALLAGCGNDSQSAPATAAFPWHGDYDAALAAAKERQTLVIADFYATWCPPCRQMDRETFVDAEVGRQMAKFVALKVDVDVHKDLARRYGIEAMPTSIILDAQGKALATKVGFLGAEDYLAFLKEAGGRRQ